MTGSEILNVGTGIGMIWAQDRRGALGSGTGMLWHVPADYGFFKRQTMGHPILMGRNSWESMDCQALPGRRNIVITRSEFYEAPGADVVGSLEEAIALGRVCEGGELVWITGGAQIYEIGMDVADFLVVSHLDLDASSDEEQVVYAPTIDGSEWELDGAASDTDWRPVSGDARWRVEVWRRR